MAKKPEPRKPISWKVYKIANKLVWLGDVEASVRSWRDGKGRSGIQGTG